MFLINVTITVITGKKTRIYMFLCNLYDSALSKLNKCQMGLMHEIKLTYAIIYFTASTHINIYVLSVTFN